MDPSSDQKQQSLSQASLSDSSSKVSSLGDSTSPKGSVDNAGESTAAPDAQAVIQHSINLYKEEEDRRKHPLGHLDDLFNSISEFSNTVDSHVTNLQRMPMHE